MKIGIIGSGVVGQTLAKAFTTLGHDVKIGTRQPNGDSFADVAAFGDWPLHFLLTSLEGGVFGSVLASLGARHRGEGISHGAYVAGGLLTGLSVAIAFAVGLNLTGLKVVTQDGEAVIVIVSALGAIFGLPDLGRVVPALGRALAGARAADASS